MGECLSECPVGYYETEGGDCMKCFKGCKECKGEALKQYLVLRSFFI